MDNSKATVIKNKTKQEVVNEITSAKSMGTKKYDSTFNELKAIQSTVRKFKFSDLIVPILSLISLILLSIFVYVPMVTSGLQNIKENKEAKANIEKLTALNTTLSQIDTQVLNDDLLNAQSVIPYSLQVSDFVSYVDDLAKKKGLKFKEILAGDILVRDSGTKKGMDSVMKGVSGPVKYSGTLDQLVEFLDGLQKTSPFILSANQIVIENKGTGNTWDISINVTGYYLDKTKIEKPNIYAKFTAYSGYDEILQIFKTKAESLKNN